MCDCCGVSKLLKQNRNFLKGVTGPIPVNGPHFRLFFAGKI